MVQIENLSYSYKNKKVFENLSIVFEPGSIYGLLGKNGTGKSTLFRNICGLLKPQQGSIENFGFPSVGRSPQMLSKLFLLPEEFFVPNVLVEKFVDSLAPFYPKFKLEEFKGYCDSFEIPSKQRLNQMSMGQKKKTLIAFSLATNTELLLMDEPTNGLDIVSKSQFKKVLSSAAKQDKCIIISTHQVRDIENLIDRICVIDNGAILFNESISVVGKKLNFEYKQQFSRGSNVVYAEEGLQGIVELMHNTSGIEAKVDLELLYKAIMLETEKITNVFQR